MRIQELNSVRGRVDRISKSRAFLVDETRVPGMSSVLDSTRSKIEGAAEDIGVLSQTLEQIAAAYARTEKNYTVSKGNWWKWGPLGIGSWETEFTSFVKNGRFDLLNLAIGASSLALGGAFFDRSFLPFGKNTAGIYLGRVTSENSDAFFGKISGEAGLELKAKRKLYESDDDIKDTSYWRNGEKIDKKDAPDFYKRKATLLEGKIKGGVSASIFEGEFTPSENAKIDVAVGKAEASGELSGGLYVLDSDGKKKFSPGVSAVIGASATALSVESELQWIGDKNLGLNSDLDLTVGKAEAKADVKAQVFRDDGKLDLQVGGSVKAEAIAAEAEGSLDMNLLGGEVGVKGSVNFGIGAHADVGFRDGVFKVDLGASVGIGGSIGFEVDVGGMVDTVVSGAQSVMDGIGNAWNGFMSWFR